MTDVDAGADIDDLDTDDDEDEVDEVDGNRVVGGLSVGVLDYLAKAIVEDPDSVEIEVDEGRRSVTLRLRVSPSDMGRVIGRRGTGGPGHPHRRAGRRRPGGRRRFRRHRRLSLPRCSKSAGSSNPTD